MLRCRWSHFKLRHYPNMWNLGAPVLSQELWLSFIHFELLIDERFNCILVRYDDDSASERDLRLWILHLVYNMLDLLNAVIASIISECNYLIHWFTERPGNFRADQRRRPVDLSSTYNGLILGSWHCVCKSQFSSHSCSLNTVALVFWGLQSNADTDCLS